MSFDINIDFSDFNIEKAFQKKVAEHPLELHCPKCNEEITFSFSQVGTVITCPNCDSDIELKNG